jgi:predicted DNA binding protein
MKSLRDYFAESEAADDDIFSSKVRTTVFNGILSIIIGDQKFSAALSDMPSRGQVVRIKNVSSDANGPYVYFVWRSRDDGALPNQLYDVTMWKDGYVKSMMSIPN